MTNSKTGAELTVDIMEEYGITRLFGNPGTTEKPLIKAVSKSDEVDYILSLHEDISVGAAGGYSQRMRNYWNKDEVESPLSMVNLHTTPGLLHGAGNLFNSTFDGVPVIITTGSQDRSHEENNPVLSGERENAIEDMVKWSTTLSKAEDIPRAFRRAARKALTRPMDPVFIDIPHYVQESETTAEPIEIGDVPRTPRAAHKSISQAVNVLQESSETTILVGDQISREGEDSVENVMQLAQKLGSPVYGEVLLSEASFPADHEQWVGTLGPNEDYNEVLGYPETILSIGCSTDAPLLKRDRKESESTIIELSHNEESLNQNNQSDYSILGHIGDACNSLADEIDTNPDKMSEIRRAKQERSDRLLDVKSISYSTVDPESDIPSRYEVSKMIDEVLNPDHMFVDEGVTTGIIARSVVEYGIGQLAGIKGGGLGQGMPMATGIAIAEQEVGSDVKILNLIGDGSFQYYPQTLYTINRHVEQPMTILVPENDGYEILREDSEEEFTFSDNINISEISQGYGVESSSYDIEDNLENVVSESLNSDSIEVLTINIQ